MGHNLVLYRLVIVRASNWIGDGGQKHVGIGLFQVIDRGFNIAYLFTLVAKHNEHAYGNTPGLEQPGLGLHVDHVGLALHSVQDALGAALRADP